METIRPGGGFHSPDLLAVQPAVLPAFQAILKPEHPPVMVTLSQYPEFSHLASRPWAIGILQNLADYHQPTFIHSVYVGLVASRLGQRLVDKGRIDPDQQEILSLAGILHDNGKADLGDPGLMLLNSNEVMLPDHPLRIYAQQHVEFGFNRIMNDSGNDLMGLLVAKVMAGHHAHQPNAYEVTRYYIGEKSKELQRLLAACDQAASLGFTGGHQFIPSNLPLEKVRQRLVFGRDGNGQPMFEDIADDIMSIIAELRAANQG